MPASRDAHSLRTARWPAVLVGLLGLSSLGVVGLVTFDPKTGLALAAVLFVGWALASMTLATRHAEAPWRLRLLPGVGAVNVDDQRLEGRRVLVRLWKRAPQGRATQRSVVMIEGIEHLGAWTFSYETFLQTADGFFRAGSHLTRKDAESQGKVLAAQLGLPFEVVIVQGDLLTEAAKGPEGGGLLVLSFVLLSVLSAVGVVLGFEASRRVGATPVALACLAMWLAAASWFWAVSLPLERRRQAQRQERLRLETPL